METKSCAFPVNGATRGADVVRIAVYTLIGLVTMVMVAVVGLVIN